MHDHPCRAPAVCRTHSCQVFLSVPHGIVNTASLLPLSRQLRPTVVPCDRPSESVLPYNESNFDATHVRKHRTGICGLLASRESI